MERVTLIKRNTSAETKMIIRVLEQDKSVSFAFQSSTCTKWRLVFEDRHTASTCSIQIPLGTVKCSSSDSWVKLLQALILEGDGKIILGAFCLGDCSPNSKLIKAH